MRGLKTALEIYSELKHQNMDNSIGITYDPLRPLSVSHVRVPRQVYRVAVHITQRKEPVCVSWYLFCLCLWFPVALHGQRCVLTLGKHR